jgi:hypothetical protein
MDNFMQVRNLKFLFNYFKKKIFCYHYQARLLEQVWCTNYFWEIDVTK